MEKKYKTIPEGNRLRIIALKDFSDVKAGDKGGLIEKEYNLNQEGDCWIYENAKVSGNARVCENAKIYGHAWVYGKALVRGDAWICGGAQVSGVACVYDNARVSRRAKIYGKARVYDNAQVYGNAEIYGHAEVFEEAQVYGEARVYENAKVYGNVEIHGFACISGNVKLWATKSLPISFISIQNSKDYVILGNKKGFYLFSSDIKEIKDSNSNSNIITIALDYIKNIQTIRQIYGEEV